MQHGICPSLAIVAGKPFQAPFSFITRKGLMCALVGVALLVNSISRGLDYA